MSSGTWGLKQGTELARWPRTSPFFWPFIFKLGECQVKTPLPDVLSFHSKTRKAFQFGRIHISLSRHLSLIYGLLFQLTTNKLRALLNSWPRILFLEVVGKSV